VASCGVPEEMPVLARAIAREWLYAVEWLYVVGGLTAGLVFTALTQPHDYGLGG
jgi:hypothetical protein